MRTVIDEWHVENYAILTLNETLFGLPPYWKYKIDGAEYKPVPVYDMGGNVIAIESDNTFIGKTVEFV